MGHIRRLSRCISLPARRLSRCTPLPALDAAFSRDISPLAINATNKLNNSTKVPKRKYKPWRYKTNEDCLLFLSQSPVTLEQQVLLSSILPECAKIELETVDLLSSFEADELAEGVTSSEFDDDGMACEAEMLGVAEEMVRSELESASFQDVENFLSQTDGDRPLALAIRVRSPMNIPASSILFSLLMEQKKNQFGFSNVHWIRKQKNQCEIGLYKFYFSPRNH